MPNDLLTTDEVARALGMKPRRVRQFCDSGRLPYQRIGHLLVITRSDMEQFRKIPRPNGRPRKGEVS